MKRRPFNRQLRTFSVAIASSCLVAVWGLLHARRSQRFRAAWSSRRVVVMGGSRGLGFLLAREFARRGASVVITARDDEELVHARQSILRRWGTTVNQVNAIRCDVRDSAEVERAIRLARDIFGGIDVLVNNAGVIQVGPLESMQTKDFEQAMAVHFHGPLTAIFATLPEMRARRSGAIVNISSIGGLVAIPHLLPYVASKFALTGLSLGLCVELQKEGITITTVCPGLMRTGSSLRAWFKSQHRREYAWFALGAATPLTAMSALRAAREIVRAIERRDSLVILSWQAKWLAKVNALAPRMVLRGLGVVSRLLPAFGGIGKDARSGIASSSGAVPSAVTHLIDRAALNYGEFGPPAIDE